MPVCSVWIYLWTARVMPPNKALQLTSANGAIHSMVLTCRRFAADHVVAVSVGRRN